MIASISSSSIILEASFNADSCQYFIPSGYAKTSPAIEIAFETIGLENEVESFSFSSLNSTGSLESLESLEFLESLESLESTDLDFLNLLEK